MTSLGRDSFDWLLRDIEAVADNVWISDKPLGPPPAALEHFDISLSATDRGPRILVLTDEPPLSTYTCFFVHERGQYIDDRDGDALGQFQPVVAGAVSLDIDRDAGEFSWFAFPALSSAQLVVALAHVLPTLGPPQLQEAARLLGLGDLDVDDFTSTGLISISDLGRRLEELTQRPANLPPLPELPALVDSMRDDQLYRFLGAGGHASRELLLEAARYTGLSTGDVGRAILRAVPRSP